MVQLCYEETLCFPFLTLNELYCDGSVCYERDYMLSHSNSNQVNMGITVIDQFYERDFSVLIIRYNLGPDLDSEI